MKVLVACEESQRVTTEFRNMGIEAFSCDILDPSGGHPEWHIKDSALPLLGGRCIFETMDGTVYGIPDKWDLIVAHPPCTDLCVSGAVHFQKKREDGRQRKAIEFFCQFLKADCDHIAIENPVGIISGDYVQQWFPDLCEKYGLPIKPAQRVQPCMFGDPFEKLTCFWLKGLPPLEPTDIVEPEPRQILSSGRTMPRWYSNCGGDRKKNRSKTFPGIAKQIAQQWGGYVLNERR